MVMDYVQGWDTICDLVQVIEAAQSVNPVDVKKAYETIDSIDTAFGPAKMGGTEWYGINHAVARPFAFARIMDGKITNLPVTTPVVP